MNSVMMTSEPTSSTHAAEPGGRGLLKLSEELTRLIQLFQEKEVTLREVISIMHGRAYTLLLILLALPFCTPIPLPGLSTPFGVVVALIGFRLSLRLKPWLPARLLSTKLPPRFFSNLLGASRRVISLLEWGLRPRWTFLVDEGVMHHLYGAVILISGLLLLLPLPIPLSNTLPAWAVILTASALLERDGYCAVAALAMFGLTLAFFGVLAWGGSEGISWGLAWLQG